MMGAFYHQRCGILFRIQKFPALLRHFFVAAMRCDEHAKVLGKP
jgi:hypothetical protein